ncbi:methyl-accepting chemotaxis protein [Acetonema longum]|uniref:Methyl-accepting chemotaxis protein n=1 Tax=Acetonema longum DSM 6540 TaxID=1009370 RepID=F7NKN9_9FIRM|nr:methyl-accepting chemotaxis protein [Acetonema longum]EGO63343.1 methyl-accepting chemotaxis protein [Acetonema longum DSM 6540]
MKSIQTKLTLTVLTIFFVALSLLGGINYWKARGIITENITKDITRQTEISAGGLGDWLEARKTELAIMALTPAVKSGDRELIRPLIANVVKEKTIYSIIGYIYPDGTVVNTLGTSVNLREREYFKKAMQGESFIADPFPSKTSGHLNIVVSVPVKVNGMVAGVLYGAIDVEGLTERVLDIKAGRTGYGYVVQGDGLTIFHPDQEIAMQFNPLQDSDASAELQTATARMITQETGLIEYDEKGVNKMMTFAPIPGVNWSLALTVPTAEITEGVSSLTVISFIIIAAVLIIAGLLIIWFARRIAKPIQKLEISANRIATGDLSQQKVDVKSNDEIGRLGRSFEQMALNLRGLIQKVQGATEQVSASSEQLTASSAQAAQAANQVAGAINDVATGAVNQLKAVDHTIHIVEQLSAEIQEAAANAGNVTATAQQTLTAAQEGGKAVQQATSQMANIEKSVDDSAKMVDKLGERSQEIGKIVDTIAGIAGQTNLLALNAAIEAARAGEQGRGFAVVAEEVRKLAEQSQAAAKQIAELITEIQNDTDKTIEAMNEGTREVRTGTEVVDNAGRNFGRIVDLIGRLSGQVNDISTAMEQMAASSRNIVVSVKEIDDTSKQSSAHTQTVSAATEEQLASMEEIASSSQALAGLAQDLQTAAARFRV